MVTLPLTLDTTLARNTPKIQIRLPSDGLRTRFVLVRDVDQKVKLLIHREATESLGHLFLWTTCEDHAIKYILTVCLEPNGESRTMTPTLGNASAEDMSQTKLEERRPPFLYRW